MVAGPGFFESLGGWRLELVSSAGSATHPFMNPKTKKKEPVKVIASRNYRPRPTSKWLVRNCDPSKADYGDPKDATPVDTLILKDVRFGPAPVFEAGFGCRIVAFGQRARSIPKNQKFVELKFDFDTFRDPSGARVSSCKYLSLTDDGRIYAIV